MTLGGSHKNTQSSSSCVAGALVAYLWRNRSLSKTSEQLNSIVGVLIFNLVLGGIQDTSIDNIGKHLLPCNCKAKCLILLQGRGP